MGGRSVRSRGPRCAGRRLGRKIRNALGSRGGLRWSRHGTEGGVGMRLLLLALLPLVASQQGSARDEESPTWFEITTETGMPNLENNLRYLTTHEKRCLTRAELHRFFPVLDHPALAGCHLGVAVPREVSVVYPLVCEAHGTTGQAIWETNVGQSVGTLNIKLGGKNMTFFQRVTASDRGGCGR
jgi:hypothetical protein